MPKKLFTTLQFIHLAMLAFGIQFVNSLQLVNMSSLYKFLGAPNHYLTYLGLAAPLAGLLIQPLVGHLSDETLTRYGRRYPYIIFWSGLASVGMLLLAFVNSLWGAVVLMWLISCSVNGAIESLRALTGDIVPNQQKAAAFSWQTILAGIGAGLAVTIPYLFALVFPRAHLAQQSVPLAIKIAFIMSALVLFASLRWTLARIKEDIPRHVRLLALLKKKREKNPWQKLAVIYQKLLANLRNMPSIIQQFGLIQIFTWMGLYAMWLFFSLAIAQHLYGLPFDADIASNAAQAKLLEQGTLQANFYFSIYQLVSVLYAVFIPWLSAHFPLKKIHGVSLIIGAMGLTLLGLTRDSNLILVAMFAVGIMWGSVMTLPYAIIAEALPKNRMGIYLGIFNISITLPQIFAGIILHPIYVYLFRQHAMSIIMISGLLILIGGILTIYPVAVLKQIATMIASMLRGMLKSVNK